ncbi:PAS domain-containing protein [Oceanidesulfovibrio marinus]|uniref:histidine kinase n=2 Tax=Oceanidesulfovibrio marinus TaxID=370038 RepID=A0ABX6NGQ6_9BACT|nr:PAS domain-containing protein [Oceanidesulfovibrio marinus]
MRNEQARRSGRTASRQHIVGLNRMTMNGFEPSMMDQVAAALEAMQSGAEPESLEEPADADTATVRAIRAINKLCDELAGMRLCAQNLSRGELGVAYPAGCGPSVPLKGLDAVIREFAQQLDSIASGNGFTPGEVEGEYGRLLCALDETLNERQSCSDEAHRRLDALFDTIPGFIITLDRDLIITDINGNMLSAYGLSDRPELIGRPCHEVIYGRDTPCDMCIVEEMFRTERPTERYSTAEEEARTGKSYRFRAGPVRDGSGAVVGAIKIGLDITDLKETQQALSAARDEAESANRVKSEFLANMSHEIRTPMNGILGMTELVLDMELTDEQREYLGAARDSAVNLMRIIDDILALSKIEAGSAPAIAEPFSLSSLLRLVCDSYSDKACERGNSLSFTIHSSVPGLVVGDPDHLRQVLSRIISNAIKFTRNGRVEVEVRAYGIVDGEHNHNAEGIHLLFIVRDTGIGIAPDKVASIFDTFSQVDGSFTREYSGTGLGLSIARRLVQRMGGNIWVESVENEGSSFYFTVPFASYFDDSPACNFNEP